MALYDPAKKITFREAIATELMLKAKNGDLHAIKIVLDRVDEKVSNPNMVIVEEQNLGAQENEAISSAINVVK